MERIANLVAAGVAAVALLGACAAPGGGPPTPPPTPTPSTVLSFGDPETPVHASSLAPGAVDRYELDADGGAGQVIVFELSAELRLVQRTPAGDVVALAESSERFGPGVGFAGGSGPAPQAIVPTAPCRGSCIVVEGAPGAYLFEVQNPSGATVAYEVYLYDAPAADTEEPNGTLVEAGVYVIDTVGEGAIETVFDTDWWLVQAGELDRGTLLFDAPGGIGIVAYLHPLAGAAVGPFVDGSRIDVAAGDALRVVSEQGFAARGANGYYYFSPTETVVPLDD